MITFKYRTGAAALRNLSEGTIYFAQPSELNDVLEAKYEMADAAAYDKVFSETLCELGSSRGEPLEYAPDPEDVALFESAHEREDKKFFEASQRVGIFSTARRPDNQPMWAYYCNNSQGVCFELEWTQQTLDKHQLFPTAVDYSLKSRIHNRAEDFRDLLLEVARRNTDWSFTQLKEYSLSEDFRRRWGVMSVAKSVSTKHGDWQHENEVRVLASVAGPQYILREVLKRIIFTRTDFAEWGAIMMVLHHMYPSVELAMVSFHHTEPLVRYRPMVKKLVQLPE